MTPVSVMVGRFSRASRSSFVFEGHGQQLDELLDGRGLLLHIVALGYHGIGALVCPANGEDEVGPATVMRLFVLVVVFVVLRVGIL